MKKYLAHVEYEILYSGKRLHSAVEDIVADPASYCRVHDEEWHVLEFEFQTLEHIKCSDNLEISVSIDVCDKNNQFIMHTRMRKKLKRKLIAVDERVNLASYVATVRMYVPVKETKDED